MGPFIVMSISQRELSCPCSTVHDHRRQSGARLERSICVRLPSHAALLAISFLFGAGCTGNAGDLFDEVEQEVAAAGTNGGAGGTRGGAAGQTSAGGSSGQGGRGNTGGGGGASPAGAGGRGGVGAGSNAGGSGNGSSSGSGNGSGNAEAGSAGAGPDDPNAGGGPGQQPPACDPCPCNTGEFGEPELVAGLDVGVSSFGPAPSADGLTLFFSAIDGDEDLFFATRENRANEFSLAAPVLEVNDPEGEDGTPFISVDGRSLYFFSTRLGPGVQGGRDLWVATRAVDGGTFGAPEVVAGVNTEGLEHLPRLSADGNTLSFVSSRDSENLGSNIWVSERGGPGEGFGEPVELPGVNTDVREEGFWLSEDGLSLVFASNRAPDEADMDIWRAVRQSRDSAFDEPENLSVVNTSGIEIDPALTRDGFELFFASDRSGSMQLYRSARSCP
jgi:Tol biopolymer transport system component